MNQNFRWDDITEIFLDYQGKDVWHIVYVDYLTDRLINLYENCDLLEAYQVAHQWREEGKISIKSCPNKYVKEFSIYED